MSKYRIAIMVPMLIVPAILSFLFASSKRAKLVTTEDGWCLLQYSRGIKGFAVAITLFSYGILAFGKYVVHFKDIRDLYYLLGLFTLFAAYLYIEFFTVKIWVGPEGIRGTSCWRGRREYTWQEIETITYSRETMWFKITARNKPPLRIHAMISGIPRFQEFYRKHLRRDVWISADENYNQNDRAGSGTSGKR